MTLLAPLFLAGLLAIGLPLWLHRLSSENPNRRPFSSLMFLEAGEPRRVLAKQLQYLLLLALRVGLLVLLVLAFAQPALFRDVLPGGGEGARHHLIVLDASASMGFEDRFDAAQARANDIIGDLGGDDRAQVVLAGRTPELLTMATTDRSVLRQAVNTASPGAFHIDYGVLTRALEGVVAGAELPVVLHWVTDVQASSLPTRFATLAPRSAARIEVHPVGEAGARNWAVARFGGSALSGELTATVESYADVATERTLVLEQNGTRVATREVAVPARGSVDVDFEPLSLATGPNRVRVTLEPRDGLAADDARFLALKRPEPRPVLIVSGQLTGRDTLFVSAAMETLTGLSLVPDTTTPARLGDYELGGYEILVVNDAGALDETALTDVEDYVTAGGAVLMGLGPRSVSLDAVPLTGQPYLSGGGRSLARDEFAAIGAIDATHPALSGVDGLRSARFYNHIGIEPAAGDAVLVALENGDPLLVESALGDGRVLLLTSTLDREWSDLPVQPAFVPLVAGLSDHLLGGAGFTSEADLGSVLGVRAFGMPGGRIFGPGGEPAVGLGGGTEGALLDQTGFYEVQGGGRTEIVAVNFDARESDLAPLEPETVERWQALGREPGSAPRDAVAGADEAAPASLAWWVLAGLALVVLMESWVGNWHLRVRRGIAQ